ncbi:hypothetical protein [Mesorhizobium sp. M0520]|uniref:DUF7931 domain-containing protein n=1 Tax=unclassified Mesorhizobium TaxID=325217 RepID=UPI0033390332
MTMDDYIERVTRAATERKGEPVFNGSIDHARVIVKTMFKHARRTVDIFSGTLNPRVYAPDEVLDEAEFFLTSSDHHVRIILERADVDLYAKHPFYKRFSEYTNLETRVLDSVMAGNIRFHLLVADEDCYRFEQDKAQVAAIAAWGDAKGGKHLKSLFETLWERAFPLNSAKMAIPLQA